MRRLIFIVVILLSEPILAEQGVEVGRITKLLVHNGPDQSPLSQRVLVHLDGDMSGGFCPQKNWSVLLDNEATKAQYSLLLASYMAGKQVKIWGNPTEDCDADYENVRNVEIIQ